MSALSSKVDDSQKPFGVRALCPTHKAQYRLLVAIQRRAKKSRNMYNRTPEPRLADGAARAKTFISILNKEISRRRSALWQVFSRDGCGWCALLKQSASSCFQFERLASSMAEHPTGEVVGSIPARGSIPQRAETPVQRETQNIAEAEPACIPTPIQTII